MGAATLGHMSRRHGGSTRQLARGMCSTAQAPTAAPAAERHPQAKVQAGKCVNPSPAAAQCVVVRGHRRRHRARYCVHRTRPTIGGGAHGLQGGLQGARAPRPASSPAPDMIPQQLQRPSEAPRSPTHAATRVPHLAALLGGGGVAALAGGLAGLRRLSGRGREVVGVPFPVLGRPHRLVDEGGHWGAAVRPSLCPPPCCYWWPWAPGTRGRLREGAIGTELSGASPQVSERAGGRIAALQPLQMLARDMRDIWQAVQGPGAHCRARTLVEERPRGLRALRGTEKQLGSTANLPAARAFPNTREQGLPLAW